MLIHRNHDIFLLELTSDSSQIPLINLTFIIVANATTYMV